MSQFESLGKCQIGGNQVEIVRGALSNLKGGKMSLKFDRKQDVAVPSRPIPWAQADLFGPITGVSAPTATEVQSPSEDRESGIPLSKSLCGHTTGCITTSGINRLSLVVFDPLVILSIASRQCHQVRFLLLPASTEGVVKLHHCEPLVKLCLSQTYLSIEITGVTI